MPPLSVPDAGVAFIETVRLADLREGIKRLTDALVVIDREFKPRLDEVQKLTEKAEAASGDRKKELEDEARRKREAGRADLSRRVQELTGPIYQDVTRSLVSFCQQHGISLVFDLSKMTSVDALPPYSHLPPPNAPDVTAAFVAAYNRGRLKP